MAPAGALAISVLGLALCGALTNAETGNGAEFFRRCARDDPDVNGCLNGAIQYAIRSLGNGYEKLGLPKLDPLTLEKVTLKDPRGITLDLLNYDVNGLRDVEVENTTVSFSDEDNFRLSFDLFLPQFDAAGSYKMSRFFLDSPKANDGQFTFNLTGYRVNFVLDGKIEKRSDGKRYAVISGVSSDFYGGTNPKVNFNNNSVGRNRLWNRDPAPVLKAYKEAIDAIHPTLAATFSNLIFDKVPIDDLFPSSFVSVSPAAYFKRCSRDDANLNECLNGAIQYALRSLKDGNTRLGLPKLDPLLIEKLTLKDPKGVTMDLSNYDVVGIRNIEVQNTSLTFSSDKSFRLSFDLLLPQFDASGSYKMNALFLDSPKANNGNFIFNLTNYRVNFVLDGAISSNTDGKNYAQISGLSSSFNGGINARVNFNNNSLGRNRLWNREPAPVLKAYKDAIDALHPVLAAAYSNILFSQVSFDELLPATSSEANAILLSNEGVGSGVSLFSKYSNIFQKCDQL